MARPSFSSKASGSGSGSGPATTSSTGAPAQSGTPSLSITPHTSDPALSAFLGAHFDPTAYLNGALPSLAVATTQQPIIPARHAALPEVAARAGEQLAGLGALQARLVASLTTLTDDMLRSGARLAYEVEVLRGEAAVLHEVLGAEDVRADIERFVVAHDEKKATGESGGQDAEALDANGGHKEEDATTREKDTTAKAAAATVEEKEDNDKEKSKEDASKSTTPAAPSLDPHAPPALSQLRTLQQVRSNLSAVRSAFNAALSFPLPPSLISASQQSSSFVSVAPPSDPAQEAAGNEALARTRASIMDCIDPTKDGGSADAAGFSRAGRRLAELRDLCTLWKGTVEEKARQKVLDGWDKELTEARDRLGVKLEEEQPPEGVGTELDTGKEAGGRGRDGGASGSRPSGEGYAYGARRARAEDGGSKSPAGSRTGSREASASGGQRKGLFGRLGRLKDELYLE